ncbi:MAG: MarR family winged helix-turn-helix transcriptional regulator [Thermomicrobiales bacterium]
MRQVEAREYCPAIADPYRESLLHDALQAHDELLRAARLTANLAWRQLDLGPVQLRALVTLADVGALPVSRLADALGLRRPATSLLVRGLAEQNLVLRSEDPVDHRRTVVQLTGHGRALLAALRQEGRRDARGQFTRLTDADLAALAQGLRALAALDATMQGKE